MAQFPHQTLAGRDHRPRQRRTFSLLVVTLLMLAMVAGIPFDRVTTAAPQRGGSDNPAREQSGSVPGMPNLVSPPTGTTYGTTPISVTLTWQAVAGASGYQVVINGGDIQSSWISGTSWTTPQLGNGQYSWQVQARNGNGTGNLTPKWVFWVDPSTGTPNPSPSPGPAGPSLSRSPYQGQVGTLVSVTASDFGANETVKLYWGDDSSGTFLGQAQTDGSGTGSTTITIPQDSPGWHDYTGIGQSSKQQAWGAIQILDNDPPSSGGGGGMVGPGTYAVTATEEGLVGDTTSNGHVILPMDNFVSLPACTSTACPWLGSSAPANCGSDCYVRVTNPDTGQCAVAPVYDVGPWFTNDDYWNPTGSRILNNLSSTVNVLPQGYTAADASRDGLDVGYGRANDGIGISNVGYEVGNRAAIDLAEGTWTQIGYQIGDGIGPAVVTMLWQTGEDPSSSAAACGQSGTGPNPSPGPSPPGGGSGNTAITTDSLNLRSGPGTTFPVLTVMPAGTTVTLTGQSQIGFLSVQYQNLNGWASSQYLQINGSPAPSPSPSPSPSPDPAVSVSPNSGSPGSSISLTATGFTPGETVAQYWGAATLAGAWGTADGSGKATINRKVPNVATGSVTLRVKGLTSGQTASTGFTVTSPSPSPGGNTATTTDSLNLRTGPAMSYSVITVMPAGATVTLTGQSQDGYSSVHYQTYDGWAATQYLKIAASPSPTPSPSPSASPAVTVAPTSGTPGTAMTLTATGFTPGETVAQYWGNAALAGAWGTADGSGKATINRKVPNVPTGSVTLRVTGLTSGKTASTGFMVTAPSPSPSPSPGGNAATTTDNLNLRSGPGSSYSVITVIPAGATVTLTGQSQNGYLPVHYQTSDGWSAAQYLQVASSASASPSASSAVTVSPGTGATGTAMTLTASGFAPGETVAQYWGNATLAGAWGTADSNGNATIKRTVPNVPAGSVNLRVVGTNSGRTASTGFSVTAEPTLSMSPSQGPQGTKVTASGAGFPATTSVQVLWKISSVSSGTQVCTATTSNSGTFSCQFSAPSLTSGQTYVIAAVAGSQSASANFMLSAGGSLQAQSKAAVATPAAVLSPSASPNPSPAASPGPAPSPSPTSSPAPESTVTPGTPTVSQPTATPSPSPTTTGPGTPEVAADSQSEASAATTTPPPAETASPSPATTAAPPVEPAPTTEPTMAPTPTVASTVEPAPTEEPTVEPTPTEEATALPEPTQEPTVEAAPTDTPAMETTPADDATVAPAPTEVPQTQELDFSPVANASVSAADPDNVLPTDVLPAGGPDGDIAFVTFQVNGIATGTVVSAKLVLTGAGEHAGDGGTLGALPDVAIDEGSVTYNTAPAVQAPSVAGVGWLEPGGQVVIDVTGTVTVDGTITFLITGNPDSTVAIAGDASTLVVKVSQ